MEPTTSFIVSLASKISGDLILAATRAVRKRFTDSEQSKALEDAVSKALEAAFDKAVLPEDPNDPEHYHDLLSRFMGDEEVIDTLVCCIDPTPGLEVDTAAVVKRMDEKIVLADLPDFEPAAFLADFVRAFYRAAASNKLLHGAIQIRLLGEIRANGTQLAAYGERIALASEGIHSETAESKVILEKIYLLLKNKLDFSDFERQIQATIETGYLQQHSVYQHLSQAVEEVGYQLEIGLTGETKLNADSRGELEQAPVHLRGQLEQIIRTARHGLNDRQPSEEELDALEEHYRRHLVDWLKNLEFRGMSPARAIHMPLEDVYVALRAVAEIPEQADTFSIEERRLLLETEVVDANRRAELMRELDVFRRDRWSGGTPERKSIAEALHDPKRHAFVILGDPGSGKTTLLHFLALVYARGGVHAVDKLKLPATESDRLPIFAPLAAFDDMLSEQKGLRLRDFISRYYDRRRGLPGLAHLFDRALDSGRALVLLDGLDEVLDVGTRTYVAEQVGAMINELAPRGVRFAVTSRFVGYRDAPVPGGPPSLSVLDFGKEEIRIFINQWSRAFERWSADGEDSPEVHRKATVLARELMQDVEGNPGVARLAANPLMLTMLALLRRQVGRLPHRRVELYSRYLETMLENWITARSPGARERLPELMDRRDAERILIPLAFWLQRNKPSGTAGSAEMERVLVDIFLDEAGLDVEAARQDKSQRPALREAEDKAKRFLNEMRNMSGLLVARGHNAFGFLHLTFQEYYAGRALARLSPDERWETLLPYLHEPRWREPLLLCAGHLGVTENRRVDVTDLIRRIADNDDIHEAFLHRNLLLALAVLADDVKPEPALLKRITACAGELLKPEMVPSLGVELMAYLAQISANGEVAVLAHFEGVWACDDEWFRCWAVEVFSPHVEVQAIRDLLLDWLSVGEGFYAREAIFKALGRIAVHDDKARHVLVDGLGEEDEHVCLLIFKELVPLVKDHPGLKTALLEKIQSVLDYRYNFVVALAPLVAEDPEVYEVVLGYTTSTDINIRSGAFSALQPMVMLGHEESTQVLKQGLDDQASSCRISTITALMPLASKDAELQERFLGLLDDPSWDVRKASLEALAFLLETDDFIRRVFLNRLRDPIDGVRETAVKCLGPMVETDEEVRKAVQAMLSDSENRVRIAAFRLIFPFLKPVEIERLIHLADQMFRQFLVGNLVDIPECQRLFPDIARNLNTSETEVFICEMITALEPLADMPSVHLSMGNLLKQHSDSVFLAAAGILKNDPASEGTRKNRLHELVSGRSGRLPELVVWFMLPFVVNQPEIIDPVLAFYWHFEIRWTVIEQLPPVLPHNPVLQSHLFALLKSDQSSKRAFALDILGAGLDAETAVQRLSPYLEDDDADIVVRAVKHLAPYLQQYPVVRQTAQRILEKADQSQRRAFISELKAFSVRSPDFWLDNISLLDDSDETVRIYACEAFAALAEDHPVVQNALLRKLGDSDPVVRAFFAAALEPLANSNAAIREEQIKGLRSGDLKALMVVAGGLASLAANDDSVCRAFLACLRDSKFEFRNDLLEALTGKFPWQSEIALACLGLLEDEDTRVRWSAVKALAPLVADSPELVGKLLALLDDWAEPVRWEAMLALMPLQDKPIRDLVWLKLVSETTNVKWLYLKYLLTHFENHPEAERLSDLKPWLFCGAGEKFGLRKDEQPTALRKRLANLFAPRLPQEPELVEELMNHLKNPRASARLGAFLTLAAWPGGPPETVLSQLIETLDDWRDLASYPARLEAAAHLINHNQYCQEMIDLCLEALEYGIQPWESLEDSGEVRHQAAGVLSKLEPVSFDQRAYNKLLNVMENDNDKWVQDAAYEALVRLARARDAQPTPT